MLVDALPPPPPPQPGQVVLVSTVDRSEDPKEALQLIDASTSDIALGARRGRALLRLGRHDEAADTFWRVLRVHRKHPDPYLGLAWTYLDEAQYGMAHLPLEFALTMMPKFQPGWRELARCYYWLKRYDRSEIASQRAISLNALDAQAWQLRGLVLRQENKNSLAVVALTRASALAPKDALARRLCGSLLLGMQRAPEAEMFLREALMLNPDDRASSRMLVRALWSQGRPWEALLLWWRN